MPLRRARSTHLQNPPRQALLWVVALALALTGLITAPAAAATDPFDVSRAALHIHELAEGIGPRPAASDAEERAAVYIEDTLRELGYTPTTQIFRLPNSMHSRNVVAQVPGGSTNAILLGAHYDSKAPSPGANDNGTGAAVLLELARILADETPAVTVTLVFFGAEETIDSNPDHHHYGSRHYVASLSPAERARLKAMISVDMVGYGPEFRVRTMGVGPQSLRDRLLEFAGEHSYPLTYLRDPGRTGWSDHEPFELDGIPAAWLEWRDDPDYHTTGDDFAHISLPKVHATGQMVLEFVRGLSGDDLLFHDVAPDNPFRGAILDLGAAGVLSGYADNTFRPDAAVVRAQFAKLVTGAVGAVVEEALICPFPDLPDDLADDLYPHDYVAAAARDGFVRGYSDGLFRPYGPVTRAQVVTVAVRALEARSASRLPDVPEAFRATWHTAFDQGSEHARNARLAEYVGLLDGLSLAGDARDPWQPMPRGETARVLWNLRGLLDIR